MSEIHNFLKEFIKKIERTHCSYVPKPHREDLPKLSQTTKINNYKEKK
jgi:hypothetical protein